MEMVFPLPSPPSFMISCSHTQSECFYLKTSLEDQLHPLDPSQIPLVQEYILKLSLQQHSPATVPSDKHFIPICGGEGGGDCDISELPWRTQDSAEESRQTQS